jgi:hypothetical protein
MKKGKILSHTFLLLVLMSTILTIGCTNHFFKAFRPQSHFDYPNSNVIPLGRVTGEASYTTIFTVPWVDSDLIKQAITDALQKKPGADMLINYMEFEDRTDILFIHIVTLRVEGIAAKMEIGKQKLF